MRFLFYGKLVYIRNKCIEMKNLLLLVFVLFFSGILKAQNLQVVVPYTLADRERMIRIEARMDAIEVKIGAKMESLKSEMNGLESKMNVKFESIQIQINQLSTMFFWGFGILIILFVFMMGYMIWDRRTALQPALDKATASDTKSTTLVLALREYAKKHADLAEILKSHGIL